MSAHIFFFFFKDLNGKKKWSARSVLLDNVKFNVLSVSYVWFDNMYKSQSGFEAENSGCTYLN